MESQAAEMWATMPEEVRGDYGKHYFDQIVKLLTESAHGGVSLKKNSFTSHYELKKSRLHKFVQYLPRDDRLGCTSLRYITNGRQDSLVNPSALLRKLIKRFIPIHISLHHFRFLPLLLFS